ncbi:MAG TPA: LLM class flavin-dependent oxidoreductase [Phycicoccus sp.]|nr:LLM class flavin-dependent oxidoreductase [Phycicoccus sp.]
MRIGVNVEPYSPEGIAFAVEAERLGVDALWSPEAWGYDAFTPLAFLAARTDRVRLISGIAQLGARTPANLAMTAMSMQALSGGRFVLGLGVSGPQVVEGWHGIPFAKPVQRTRETIEIVRMICRGERAAYDGNAFQLPLPGGEGKAIRSMAPPVEVPIFLAALGPANLRLTGEVADGWVGNSFLPASGDALLEPIREGAVAAGRDPSEVELTVAVSLEFSDDVEAVGRKHAGGYAFTFGAMGSAKTNFYSSAFARQGFGEAIEEVHRLWQAGDREGAAAAVPLEIGLRTNLVGTDDLIREQLQAYAVACVSTLRVTVVGEDTVSKVTSLGRLMDLVGG